MGGAVTLEFYLAAVGGGVIVNQALKSVKKRKAKMQKIH